MKPLVAAALFFFVFIIQLPSFAPVSRADDSDFFPSYREAHSQYFFVYFCATIVSLLVLAVLFVTIDFPVYVKKAFWAISKETPCFSNSRRFSSGPIQRSWQYVPFPQYTHFTVNCQYSCSEGSSFRDSGSHADVRKTAALKPGFRSILCRFRLPTRPYRSRKATEYSSPGLPLYPCRKTASSFPLIPQNKPYLFPL